MFRPSPSAARSIILYDLADIDIDDQIDARRQVMKFIKNMPDGTRFAIFVRSDGLYLVRVSPPTKTSCTRRWIQRIPSSMFPASS